MPAKLDEFSAVMGREKWRPPTSEIDAGNHFVIALTQNNECVKGDAEPGQLIPGLTYRFFGRWEESEKFGRQFLFQAFAKAEPHSRFGLVNYLARHAPHVGPRIAGRLFDAFQSDACKILRTEPQRAAEAVPGLTLEHAKEAAEALAAIATLEDTKIELTNLFAGRGFPRSMTDQVIRKLGPLAPERIKRDPFCLLVYGFNGAGFSRCDRLYNDLGLSTKKLKRQMICLWHAIREDRNGHTWIAAGELESTLKASVGGVVVDLKKAVRLGRKSKWLAVKKDSAGRWWIADGKKAANEKIVAECVARLTTDPPKLPRFTESIGGECEQDREDESFSATELESLSALDTEALLRIGRQTKICQRCGRLLTHPESLRIGIGPTCAAAWNVPWGDGAEIESGLAEANA